MVEGVNSNSQAQYTMQSLGIQENSQEASIFKKIDLSDGKEDGYLTALQFEEYNNNIQSQIDSAKQQAQALENKQSMGLENQDKKGLEAEMQKFLSDFEGAKYIPHAKYDKVGQLRYKGEWIVIIKHSDNRYEVVRQHEKEQHHLKSTDYDSLDDLYNTLSNDEYGWGRDTFSQDGPPFTMDDLMFYDTGSMLVYRTFG